MVLVEELPVAPGPLPIKSTLHRLPPTHRIPPTAPSMPQHPPTTCPTSPTSSTTYPASSTILLPPLPTPIPNLPFLPTIITHQATPTPILPLHMRSTTTLGRLVHQLTPMPPFIPPSPPPTLPTHQVPHLRPLPTPLSTQTPTLAPIHTQLHQLNLQLTTDPWPNLSTRLRERS